MPTTTPTPHTVEALLRVVEERDSEVVFLKLMVDKLTLGSGPLAQRNRAT